MENRKILTLCIIQKDDKILLGMKKKGFGVGRWNGFGGKVEIGESIEEGAIREVKEEIGVVVPEIKKIGILDFTFENEPKILEVHIFKAENFEGEILESEEMRPEWFAVEKIPFEQMWSDDIHWMPYFLENNLFKGRFHFDRPSDSEYSSKILQKELEEVKSL
jgi:8-oxo-dGTP diphosphatase / 2-hydroxy-dATP diphosphatase